MLPHCVGGGGGEVLHKGSLGPVRLVLDALCTCICQSRSLVRARDCGVGGNGWQRVECLSHCSPRPRATLLPAATVFTWRSFPDHEVWRALSMACNMTQGQRITNRCTSAVPCTSRYFALCVAGGSVLPLPSQQWGAKRVNGDAATPHALRPISYKSGFTSDEISSHQTPHCLRAQKFCVHRLKRNFSSPDQIQTLQDISSIQRQISSALVTQ